MANNVHGTLPLKAFRFYLCNYLAEDFNPILGVKKGHQEMKVIDQTCRSALFYFKKLAFFVILNCTKEPKLHTEVQLTPLLYFLLLL